MEKFLETYQNLTAANLDQLANLYTEDIRFVDPAHEIDGLANLTLYFANLYKNIDSIKFNFTHHLRYEEHGYVQWEMIFSHPRLKKGENISVFGTSFLRFSDSGKVCFHRDYFDLGAMLYEQLPILGRVIATIKRRLGS